MKIEVYDMWRNGRTIYYWTLFDGPDGIDKVSGYATTLEETVCKILDWRQRIANDYISSLSEEELCETVGTTETDGPQHSDPGCGDDGTPEQGS